PVRPAITAGIQPPLGVIDTSQPSASAAWMLVVPRVNASWKAESSAAVKSASAAEASPASSRAADPAPLVPRTLSGRGPDVDQFSSNLVNGFVPPWNA